MATKKGVFRNNKHSATLVTQDRAPCAFCSREVDDEVTYGKLYAIGDIQVHYFCALLSCCLVQKGKDTEGLFGFLYLDIIAEVERSKKHKCSYCGQDGASLGCCRAQCRKQFHLPCGREKNAVSLFYGSYKSFCHMHAPKQKIPAHIMAVAKQRMKVAKTALTAPQNFSNLKELCADGKTDASSTGVTESVCVICYEAVDGFPSLNTFWPPCCARDAWFHSECVQRMSLSAGMHYIKCPLCNDKDKFYDAVLSQGFYVPDRDAAWELEQNAFAEIYERPQQCGADICRCEAGRSHDADSGEWELQVCLLCGTSARHGGCGDARYICRTCRGFAPQPEIDAIAETLQNVIEKEQELRSRTQTATGPLMPSRMSLRRTKGRVFYGSSTSQNKIETAEDNKDGDEKSSTAIARSDLNLKPPRKLTTRPSVLTTIENTLSPKKQYLDNLLSPTKVVEETLVRYKRESEDSKQVLCEFKEKLKKPMPLREKKRILNILEQMFETHNPSRESQDEKNYQENTATSQKPHNNTKIESTNQDTKNNNTHRLKYYTRRLSTRKVETPNDGNTDGEILPKGKENLPQMVENETDMIDNSTVMNGNRDSDDTDESSSSFHLPSEFIANTNSDDSITLFETPRKLKTVNIEKDSSLEISENDEVVNIDHLKMEEGDAKEFLKGLNLIPAQDIDLGVECFKSYYLNEFNRQFHKQHITEEEEKGDNLKSDIDFENEATNEKELRRKKIKRKIKSNKNGGDCVTKKRKTDKKIVVKYQKNKRKNITVTCSNENKDSVESIDLTVEKKKCRKSKLREDIKVKIRFRQKHLQLKISNSKEISKRKFKGRSKKVEKEMRPDANLKQYVLNYPDVKSPCKASSGPSLVFSDIKSPQKLISKPDHELTTPKRKYEKQEKTPDNLVQTSIQSFFKKMPVNYQKK